MSEEQPDVYKPSRWGEIFHGLTDHGAPIDELLGAGSAGPGKSWVLLMDPMAQVTVEHERCANARHRHPLAWGASTGWALHLRRTRPMLDQTIARSKKVFPLIDPGAEWNENKTTWTFSSGYKYQFGHCKDPGDWDQYMSNEYCVAKGTPVLMADGSWRPMESVRVGDMVQTLEGPCPVTATWATGRKPCVSVTTEYQGEIVGTQVHPTTHPVLLWPTDESNSLPLPEKHRIGRREQPHGLRWLDYEALLYGHPESTVRRASAITDQNGFAEFGDLPLGHEPPPEYCVPVALFEPVLQSMASKARSSKGSSFPKAHSRQWTRSRQVSARHPFGSPSRQEQDFEGLREILGYGAANPSGDEEGDRFDLRKATNWLARCSVCSGLHGERLRRAKEICLCNAPRLGGVERRAPIDSRAGEEASTPRDTCPEEARYPHFYTGEARGRTERIRRGTATIAYAGFHETFDLTVAGANHYITHTGLVNAQTWIGFDELTQFEEEQYDQIITRKRSGDPVLSLMLKVRACSNPLMKKEASENFTVKDPNWVRRRFVDPDRRGKVVLKRKMVRSDGTVFYKRMMYLPATLADNPDPAFRLQYEETLLNAPAHIRQALLFGDWYVTAGSFFAEYWNEKLHVCRPFRAPSDWRFFRSMDWGFKAPGVIYWWALDDDESLYCVKELTFQGKTDAEVAAIVKEVEIGLGLWDERGDRSRITGPADTQLWEKRGDSGKSKYEVFRDLGIPWVQASKSRQTNAQYIIKRLVDHDNGTKIPGVVFFSSCKEALKTIPGIQTSDKNTEEPQDGGPDHWYDAIAYAHAYASRGKQGIPRMLDLRDEWDDSEEANMKLKRGRDGYGRN